jgi:RNA polymerase sigma-70 factor (ECF subfamily)
MMPAQPTAAADLASLPEPELAERIAGGDSAAFEVLMRRFNSRLFRVARAILRDDADAEDALQDAYIEAYRHMGDFRGASALGTWLTRIVTNSALMRLRSQRRHRVVVPIGEHRGPAGESPEVDVADDKTESPPNAALRAELRRVLERRIDSLPLAFRTVFVLREVQELSVQETAESLAIPAATVRSRLFRARALLREALAHDMDNATGDVFAFDGARCDRIVAGVLARISAAASATS